MSRYSSLCLDHFMNPRHVGIIAAYQAEAGEYLLTGQAGLAEQGDQVQLQLLFDTHDIVIKACFKAYGQPETIAVASCLTERLQGLTRVQVEHLEVRGIITDLSLPQGKWHCALGVEQALKQALINE